MDGDATAKTFDAGANSAIRSVEGSDSIHEASHQAVRLSPIFPSSHPTLPSPPFASSSPDHLSLEPGACTPRDPDQKRADNTPDTSRRENHRHRHLRLLQGRRNRVAIHCLRRYRGDSRRCRRAVCQGWRDWVCPSPCPSPAPELLRLFVSFRVGDEMVVLSS